VRTQLEGLYYFLKMTNAG